MDKKNFTLKQSLYFLIPSCIGAFAFMCPIPGENGSFVIPITYLINAVNSIFSDYLIYITLVVILCSAIFSFIGSVLKPDFIKNSVILSGAFSVKWYWMLLRVLGAGTAFLVFLKIGPEWLIGNDTGAFVLYSLLCTVIAIAVIGCGLLPLLTEFGLMEFVGTLLGPIVKRLFRLPGRAAVDCLSSWLGATSIAVILTNGQLEKGYYTQREAATIATNFSAVSITFALVVISQVGLMDSFFSFYGTVCLVAVVSAIVLTRIPPLSRKPDTYLVETTYKGEVYHAPGYSLLSWAWHQAVEKANDNGYTSKSYLTDWVKNSCMLLFSILPLVMFIGTFALAIAYFTPILSWLGYPFLPLLKLLQIPEAAAASQTMVAGFADMFIPSVIASATITSTFTRFLVAVVSITQVLYLSDNVAMILSTKIPASLLDMFIIFIERTIISLIVASLFMRFVLQIPV